MFTVPVTGSPKTHFLPKPTGTPDKSVIHGIDQKIHQYEDAIRELRSHRNSLAPISQLPPEMLSKIFMLCVTPNENQAAISPRYRWSWIKVSHICRHWRYVALECRCLWSCPDFSKPAWIPEMLKRSRMAPITIRVTDESPLGIRTMNAVNTALEHLSRVEELTLSTLQISIQKVLPAMNRSAPRLHTLCLSASDPAHWASPAVVLQKDFMKGDTPSLTHLELKDFHLPWNSPLLTNLTCLKLFQSDSSSSPTLEEFVETLSRMPGLETLELKNVLPTETVSSSQEVILSHLRNIRLEGKVEACAGALNHITFPSTTTILLIALIPAIGSQAQVQESVTPIFKPISKIRHRSVGDSTSSESGSIIMLNISCDGGIDITAGLSTPDGHSILSWMNISVVIFLEPKRKAQLAAKICQALSPLSRVRHLSINASRGFVSTKVLGKQLSSLSQVQMLEIQNSCALDVLKLLTRIRKSGRVAVFPSLIVLALVNVDFDENREEDMEVLDLLMDCLMLRYECKAEIQHLSLKTCTRLIDEDVWQLKEICADVDWDMSTTGYGESEDELEEDELEEDDSEDMSLLDMFSNYDLSNYDTYYGPPFYF
ncbi:hypothetical protein K435DRAFT_324107 [Dendrothele bispora CBS 962.96]|uniref:Uncharacterized protein n=1 Tax=Dendrothele bispora (strain CBS 962.96) TaxID=1314807 RepID=A0A4S8LHC1_DENBC|nr:hypothetical protein K435DRAFT_324107 [Dendrothele bispora CBS 962.96]